MARPAPAVPISGSVRAEAGSGWESNVFYSSDGVIDDGFVELSPTAAVRVVVAPGLHLTGDLAGTLRGYLDSDAGTVLYHAGDVGLRYWAADWLRLEIGAGYDHQYASSSFGGHAVSSAGELAVAFVWESGEVQVGYRAHARFWLDSDPRRVELSHLPRVQLYQVVTSWLAFLVGYQAGPRSADVAGYDLFGHRVLGGVVVRPHDRVRVRDLYLLYGRTFEGADEMELLHGNRLEVEVDAMEVLGVWARWDLALNVTDDPLRDYVSHAVSAGVSFHWGGDTAGLLPSGLERTLEGLPVPSDRTPVRVDGGVRFSVRAPQARTVAVVGEWSGWDPEQGALLPGEDGVWEGVVPVPKGTWEFTFLVDGTEVREPVGVDHVVDSGFGDRNGVVVVE